MTSKRPRQILTQRQAVIRAARAAKVDPEELDRAAILGQIAAFLTQHRYIGRKIAFKGGAVMHLMDGSPRFSGDLDGVVIAGKQIRQKWIDEALWDNPDAAKTFLGKPRIVNNNNQGVVYPIIECRAIRSGKEQVAAVQRVWPGHLIVSGGPPTWTEVEPGILHFQALLP